MTKKRKERTKFQHPGYNQPELEAEFPHLAVAFKYLLLRNKKDNPYYLNLWRNYVGRYKHGKNTDVRRVHLNRILHELKTAGFEVEISVKYNGNAIDPNAAFQFLEPKEMLMAHIGLEQHGLKGRLSHLFYGQVYLIGDVFWTICKQGEEPPKGKTRYIKTPSWQHVETIFDSFGYNIMSAPAEVEMFTKKRQVIRY